MTSLHRQVSAPSCSRPGKMVKEVRLVPGSGMDWTAPVGLSARPPLPDSRLGTPACGLAKVDSALKPVAIGDGDNPARLAFVEVAAICRELPQSLAFG